MARAQLPKIFPKPHSLFLHGGFFQLPSTNQEDDTLLARVVKAFPQLDVAEDSAFPSEGFSIVIDQTCGVKIRHGKRAFGYAKNALMQIAKQGEAENGLPCLTLEDAPDFRVRGFMLDVSRGRVPVMNELFALVDLLADLRYNQLQLYVEHTFAFEKHEIVWRDASPLTAEEIRALDAYCAGKNIELVPNLNSFGHVERWLKHDFYKPLAECPDGFFHEIFKMQRAAGTFRACEETADFMGKLYEEYLPNFTSKLFNIGGDEPWELGQGRSREACEARGKQTVYLEHMARLQKRAGTLGKRVQFWADVLLEEDSQRDESAISPQILKTDSSHDFDFSSAIPLIWGYEKGHQFEAQCAKVATRCKEFYVVPGTSAWLSLTGRLDNAMTNISEAVSAGYRHGATGILLTTWGDFGYHNPFCANLLPLLACAAQSWNFMGSQSPDLLYGFGNIFDSKELAAELFYAGRIDNFFTKKITNRSLVRELFFAKKSAFPQLMEGVPATEILAAKKEVERLLVAFSKMELTVPASGGKSVPVGKSAEPENRFSNFKNSIYAELELALEMSHIAICRAEAFLKNDAGTLEEIEKEIEGPLATRFAETWKLRDREGGLAESLDYFKILG